MRLAFVLFALLALLTGCHSSSSKGISNLKIKAQPRSIASVVGGSVDFVVQASSSRKVHYQWYKGTVPIIGANSPTYQIPAVTVASEGTYTVVVTDAIMTARSYEAALSVSTPAMTPQL